MKNLLILLVFSTSLCVVLSAKDYCEVQKRLCGNEKHIGCDKNAFKRMESLYSLKLGTITNDLKELILDKINIFRSLVAIGKKSQYGTASNMRLVTWNSEMEYLSTQFVLKLPILDFACCKIDTNPKSIPFSQVKNDILAPTAFLTWAFEHIFNYTVEQKAASTLKFSFFYSANLTSIGCAFGSYKGKNCKMILKCVQNEPEATSFTKTYLPGEPCSNCSMYNQVCSERYPGLCEDAKVSPIGPQGPVGPAGLPGLAGASGPIGIPGKAGLNGSIGANGLSGFDGAKGEQGSIGALGPIGIPGQTGLNGLDGAKGEKGDRGPIDPISSIYFWVLYTLMVCVVGVALFVAFKAKRKRFAPGFPLVANSII